MAIASLTYYIVGVCTRQQYFVVLLWPAETIPPIQKITAQKIAQFAIVLEPPQPLRIWVWTDLSLKQGFSESPNDFLSDWKSILKTKTKLELNGKWCHAVSTSAKLSYKLN